MDKLCVMMFTR